MSFSVDVLAKIAIELQTGIGHQDRFQRLISTLRHVLAWGKITSGCNSCNDVPLIAWIFAGLANTVMYSVPSDKSVEKVVITADSVKNGSSPMIVRKKQKEESVS